MHNKVRASAVFVLLILLVASLLLILNGRSRYQDYREHQRQLAGRAVNAAAGEIGLQIAELKRRVSLFAQEEKTLIHGVAAQPEDDALNQRLTDKLDTHFPDRLAFTVTSASGDPLVYDFDDLIGELCQRDIRDFAADQHPYELYIHPQPDAYHFDVMARWATPSGEHGVFFVSFHPRVVARVLANSELVDHRMLVLLASDPSLIEVTADGTRNKLSRDMRLSEGELRRLDATAPIPGTRWLVADLPEAGLHREVREQLWRETGMFVVALALITGAMLRFLIQSERQRHAAEARLRRAYHELELRVRDRTQRLSQANEELQEVAKERKLVLRELKEREGTLQAILRTAVDAIVVINSQGEILIFNPAAERMFGYPAAEVMGRKVNTLMPAPHRDAHDDYMRRYQETGERRIIGIGRRVQGLHKDGRLFAVDLSVSEVALGSSRLFAGILRPVPAAELD